MQLPNPLIHSLINEALIKLNRYLSAIKYYIAPDLRHVHVQYFPALHESWIHAQKELIYLRSDDLLKYATNQLGEAK